MPPDSMIFEQILDRHVVQLTKLFEEMEYSPSRAREYALFRTCQIALEEASDVDVLRNTMLYILETYHTPD